MHWGRWTFALASVAVGLYGWSSSPLDQTPPPVQKSTRVDFNREIRPLLAKHCWTCHGADSGSRRAGLRLDTPQGIAELRHGSKPIEPGNLKASLVWQRLNPEIPALQMPPPESGIEPMNDAEKALVRQWIEQGGKFERHWAFELPVRSDPPQVPGDGWVRNFVDAFVRAKMEANGLKPEPEAAPATLLRRASLTLTGLPPTPQELDSFLQDKAAGAYERAVDRLLASPRYGEHEARYWLDAVRYGDTHGLHLDNERSIWPYRDWVVRAFNEDLPYDQFVTWQLAGDLLPNPTTEQLIATGYVRLNPTTNEGGAIAEEFLAKNTFDRVDTTSTVMLGVTLGCARCHDHKYDPFLQRDYYGLFAFFNSTLDAPLDGNDKFHGPTVKAALPEQEAQLREWDAALRSLEARVDPNEARAWAEREAARRPSVGAWTLAGPYAAGSFDAAFDQPYGPEPGAPKNTVEWRPIDLPPGKAQLGVVGKANAAVYLRATVDSPLAREAELLLGSDDGVAVWLNGKSVHKNKTLRAVAPGADKVRLPLQQGANELLVKIVNATGDDGVAIDLADPLAGRLKAELDKGAKADHRLFASAFLASGPDSADAKRYRTVSAQRDQLDASLPRTLVAAELPMPRTAYVLKRGEYDKRGAPVTRAIPRVFGWLPSGAPVNRLGLAKWIVSRKNPLASRVIVNRIWQQEFGTGLVASSEDFGSRGDFPSHPELLDTLAVWFRESGWSVKKLHRLLVTSATFRQSAAVDPEKRALDPENRLLARGPRYRLDAEVLRDQALYAAGLLNEERGGHGVKPYQPPGLWEEIAYPASDTSKYVQDHGQALYRRSLYLFWKRTSPPPALLLFDAPMRESCVVRRARTNTPLQALTAMNAPAYFEASRVMAERVLHQKGPDASRIDFAFRLATARDPSPSEQGVLLRALSEQRALYHFDVDNAKKLISAGEAPRDESLDPAEHAAWTMVCNLMLNLDETVTMH
ncbi:MAG: PSD1 domain-containing protein [Chthonomonadaceae bacterium]|nr:PSD1 domain-containing protein [Chthonomonadaceae bacterium]